jgi:leader peptidase (prepilin peptidase)/N-methyltransferase
MFRAAIILAVIASPFIGCFAATAVRLNLTGAPLLLGRSRCGQCGQRLELRDLIPVFSWLFALGHCRYCRKPIPLLYPAAEFAFFATALWASQNEDPALILPGILLGWALITLFAFDVTAFVLPNVLTYLVLLGGIALSLTGGREAALESTIGATAGAASLLLVKWCYRLLKGREGLGMGDVKLFAAAGAWVGAEGLPQTLLIASLAGLLYAGFYLRGISRAVALERVPFGAGLCLGLWLTWNLGLIVP